MLTKAGVFPRFDVHAHFAPPADAGLERLAADRPGAGGGWTPEVAIDVMDERGIDLQLLSLPLEMDADLVRRSNEGAARIVETHPARFGMLASVPLGTPERALDEVRYAGDQLGADGFVLLSNYGGGYLGDPRFDPVFAELDRRAAAVLVHPVEPIASDRSGLGRPGPLLEYPVDTARTTVDAMYAGVFLRYPRIKVILAHAGGALPGLVHRILALGSKTWIPNPNGITREQMREQLASLYYETAIAGDRSVLAPVLDLAGAGHLLFGTDFPPAGLDVVDASADALAASLSAVGRSPADLAAAFRALFPAAASRADARR
ncbi:amidohydrolase family protein [Amycolatopsis ultiminotia]|uniref:6-methylsalicylate decarboxylase n=1 Tax=Amycolatopsis ultiminotia TaxID=543629 RepID=A0ABP6YL29_9PSEU